MLQSIRQARVLLVLLLGLALPHAWPGGLTLCVDADGSRRVEFGCGCNDAAAGCAGCPTDDIVGLTAAGGCCACTDFTIHLATTVPPHVDAPSSYAIVPIAAPFDAPVLSVRQLNFDALANPPPLLRQLRSTVLLI